MFKKSKRFSFTAALMACGILLVSGLCGCGGAKTDLTYDKSGSKPVVVYRTYQAIAPIYNPDAPQIIVYGDGSVIEKKGPYEYTGGMLESGGVDALLRELESEGYFSLKQDYSSGEPVAGGVTETVTVNLSTKDYEVNVENGSDPSGWENIVSAVTGLDVSGAEAYTPPGVVLFAGEEADPGNREILKWPGGAEDLADAAAGEGFKLEGDSAAAAWKAVGESFEREDEIVWEGGGKYYSYVYASPVFPGVSD
ncbi:MAG: hypothetical protein JXA49_00025 [Actinobacteria bacterium]|nr:hypothetical protein [Actinomycetota bacterium]